MPARLRQAINAKHFVHEFVCCTADLADARYRLGHTHLVDEDAGRISHSPIVVSSRRRSLDSACPSCISCSLPDRATAEPSLKAF
jgi:hypothetical protein